MGRLAVVVAFVLAGCGFHPAGAPLDARAPIDVHAPLTCAQLTCDPHATCAMTATGATCTCETGYAGDGMTCAAVDPCSTNNGGCPAACAMTGPGQASCYAPATCADVAAHMTLADDTAVTLYIGGSPTQPWTAFCHADHEYLTLPAGQAANYGQYTSSTKSPGTSVRTSYARVRIDPATLRLDICDQTFAASVGALQHDPANNGNDPVTSMPLGVAMDCAGGTPVTGVAGIDLTGTPFVVSSGWSTGGNSAGGGTASPANGGRSVAITGGGDCGWNAPTGAPGNPFNTFGNSFLIGLSYRP